MTRRSLHSGPWSSPDDVERVSRLRCFDTIILRDDHSFCQSSPPGEAAARYTIYSRHVRFCGSSEIRTFRGRQRLHVLIEVIEVALGAARFEHRALRAPPAMDHLQRFEE